MPYAQRTPAVVPPQKARLFCVNHVPHSSGTSAAVQSCTRPLPAFQSFALRTTPRGQLVPTGNTFDLPLPFSPSLFLSIFLSPKGPDGIVRPLKDRVRTLCKQRRIRLQEFFKPFDVHNNKKVNLFMTVSIYSLVFNTWYYFTVAAVLQRRVTHEAKWIKQLLHS